MLIFKGFHVHLIKCSNEYYVLIFLCSLVANTRKIDFSIQSLRTKEEF